ncbi:MAG: alpha/beta fold hydrolase [Mangrovicoccus sp.]|nr:alpha/beta fold hydrolase [Mangrovicoccus sp.]
MPSSKTQGQDSTITRMPPGAAYDIDLSAHQGWAIAEHPPTGGQARAADLIFVHGMASGGWMWSADWLASFTDQGYRCWALTLPGRAGGQSLANDPQALDRALRLAFHQGDADAALSALTKALPGMSAFDGPSLGDFTDALAEALAQIGRPAVPICHSLGGAVAQNLMRRGQSPLGTVLLCSAPPYGLWRASMEMAFTNPQLWHSLVDFSMFGLRGTDIDVMRRNLFPSGIANGTYSGMLANLTDESTKAMAQASGFPPFAPFPGPRSDVLVIGGNQDRFLPMLDVMLTGFYYGTRPVMIPEGGHMLMSEPAWPKAAQAILDWLPRIERAA